MDFQSSLNTHFEDGSSVHLVITKRVDAFAIQKAKQLIKRLFGRWMVAGVLFIFLKMLHVFIMHLYFFLLCTKFESNQKRRKQSNIIFSDQGLLSHEDNYIVY